MTSDSLTVAAVRSRLERIAAEMDLTLKLATLSPVLSEGNDLANGFHNLETGEAYPLASKAGSSELDEEQSGVSRGNG